MPIDIETDQMHHGLVLIETKDGFAHAVGMSRSKCDLLAGQVTGSASQAKQIEKGFQFN
jgi:hypothetical protein